MRNQKGLPDRQAGQVILILILVMTTALAIGLSVIQRSLSDVSTSSKVEQSSRAFSAAEAGIEKYLSSGALIVNFPDNNSSAEVTASDFIPAIPAGFGGGQQAAFECPPRDPRLAKEDVAQVWLADPDPNVRLPECTAIDPSGHSPVCYNPPAHLLNVYWGNSTTDKAALELTLVYYAGGQYQSRKWYLDNQSAGRTTTNNFEPVACTGNYPPLTGYQCKKTISLPVPASYMLIRARLLYNSSSQPFAVQAVGICSQQNKNACIPPQAKVVVSKGISGQTQRTIQVCQLQKVVPLYFDYAIFSTGTINK